MKIFRGKFVIDVEADLSFKTVTAGDVESILLILINSVASAESHLT